MSFIKNPEINQIKNKLTDDPSLLGKLYKTKKSPYDIMSVIHSLVEDYEEKGWEVEKRLKIKTRIRKEKSHARKFEDDVWCQLYDLGYRHFNFDEQFKLPFGKGSLDWKQIDVIAIDQETVILVECKSSEKPKKSGSLKTEFEGLKERIVGFRKAISLLFGSHLKMRYVFATRHLRIDANGADIERLSSSGGFYYNDNTYDYVNSLIKNYKNAARYQFLGILFRGESINSSKIEIPAIEGSMGDKKYYMFSLEPATLLKIGFVLHRTKANESEMPTYQRLLIPSRLKSINKFINEGGYFPNSIVVNFSEAKKQQKVVFEATPRPNDTNARYGTLKIPNAYAIAYIIDGQHRVYGYANTNYVNSNTIPVVAFKDLESDEQLEIFMSINENQTAVNPSLRGTLERDLYWNSDRADTRLKALRSSIIIDLAESPNGPLFKAIQVGEDKAPLKFTSFSKGLLASNLLPKASGNRYVEESTKSCLYNVNNNDHSIEMTQSQKKIVQFLNECFGFVEENYPAIYERHNSLIKSNRGVYAFIGLIGNLNHWETTVAERIDRDSYIQTRFDVIKPYLVSLLNQLSDLNEEDETYLQTSYGSGAQDTWLRTFQLLVNKKHPKYNPVELIEWKERKDSDLQDEGRKLGVEIEKYIKRTVLNTIKRIFGSNWELEINSIKRECMDRAEKEMEKNYKEGLGNKRIDWTEMFNISDYKSIIEKNWTKAPEEHVETFVRFQDRFSIDSGEGLGSKAKSIKWISRYNSLRNNWAHEGTKERGLSSEEVSFLKGIHNIFYS